jgi:hypothetical protein
MKQYGVPIEGWVVFKLENGSEILSNETGRKFENLWHFLSSEEADLLRS